MLKKACIVERFNRTIKTKMWRYFTGHNTFAYLPVLEHFVEAYNKSYHRSIKRAPISVTACNEENTWLTLHGTQTDIKPPKFNVGDRIRMSKTRGKFKKCYTTNWSEELSFNNKVPQGTPIV